jgi:uncharacterized protein YgbK (DUF1537 family)
MEVTAFAGLKTVLFLGSPAPERLAEFSTYDVIGMAGTARSQTPEWMDIHLPGVFRTLASLGSPIVHYKVCSTFDSSPMVGSIGRAIDIAASIFEGWIPLLVADPGMGRYQCFGNLFAVANGAGHRLDRHPVMARHPITPMSEADLGKHLSAQTKRRIGLVDFVAMKRGEAEERFRGECQSGAQIVSLDVLDRETLIAAGRLIWQLGGNPLFGVGSQGFEAALTAYWQEQGLIQPSPPAPSIGPVERIACVSGSLSSINARQIETAMGNCFAGVPLSSELAADENAWAMEIERAGSVALKALGEGKDVIVYTAAGPEDPAVAVFRTAIQAAGLPPEIAYARLGAGLGQILDRIVTTAGLKRAVIAGGDTSGLAASMLGVDALTAIAPLAPGSPLCRAHSQNGERDGLELALKGGQAGGPDFFIRAKGALSSIEIRTGSA